jgi:thioredoxin-like negative regulator of GroEL
MLVSRKLLLATITGAALVASMLTAAGCRQSEPKLMVFLGKSSRSYSTMKPIVDKIEKRYQGKVSFQNIDYDNAKSKSIIEKYHVTMNPTFLMFNSQGQIREQYLGSTDEENLDMIVQSYVPTHGTTKPSSAPKIPSNLKY